MDLANPMMNDTEKEKVNNLTKKTELNFYPDVFVEMCEEDQLGNLIRNTDFWVRDVFKDLLEYQ